MEKKGLKIAVFGTGGVGGIFGAQLAQAGHSVHFIARGLHAQAIRTSGLHVKSDTGDFTITPAPISESASDAAQKSGPFDLVLVCVKAWQLPEARNAIGPLITAQDAPTLLLPLLNGIEAVDYLAESYSERHVLRGFCAVISYIDSPGVIRQFGARPSLSFGEMRAPFVSERIRTLANQLSVPGIALTTPADLLTQQWMKFIFISSLAGITSLTRLTAGQLRHFPPTRRLIESAVDEVIGLAKKMNVPISDSARSQTLAKLDAMPAEGTTSMQRDFAASRRTELEAMSGYVCRQGQKLGIPTPTHQLCYDLLILHERAALTH
jgi:2-dehydropantoate 2-reductase